MSLRARRGGWLLKAVRLCALVALALASVGSLEAESKTGRTEALRGRVRRALDDGRKWLLEERKRSVFKVCWSVGGRPREPRSLRFGMSTLGALALVHAGEARTSPRIRTLLRYVDREALVLAKSRTGLKSYGLSLYLQLCRRLHDGREVGARTKARMQKILDALLACQRPSGRWNYDGMVGGGDSVGDVSNTQFAMLGLVAAVELGLDVSPSQCQRAIRGTLGVQDQSDRDGGLVGRGFTYAHKGRVTGAVTGATTAAGIVSLLTARELLDGKCGSRADEAIRQGQEWLAHYFTADYNPAPIRWVPDDPDAEDPGIHVLPASSNHLIWLYGVSWCGRLLSVDRFGIHRWYETGATKLVGSQEDDGSWLWPDGLGVIPALGPSAPRDEAKDRFLDTCFAILFLSHEPLSSGSDVTPKTSGESGTQ